MKWVEQQDAFQNSLILTFLFHPYCFQWVLKLIGVNYACIHEVISKKPSNSWTFEKQEVDMKLTPSKKINPHILLPYSDYNDSREEAEKEILPK